MYESFTLSNGLRVVAEPISHFRSVSVGLWIGAGSAYEQPEEGGLSHFIEHMLFKGTKRRSARDIADEIDGIGGQINAFTSKECTCYYAKVIDEHLPVALDVLCDLFLNSVIDEAEMEKERGVILEEIAMVEDTPEDIVHDLLITATLDGNPYSKTILGKAELIQTYRREHLVSFRDRHYRPDNTVLAVAGRYDSNALRALCEEHLGGFAPAATPEENQTSDIFLPNLLRKPKDIEQVHLCIGFPGIPLGHADLYPLTVFNNVFGGGMSSRLFQRIREESGMAYTVYSYPTPYPGCGIYTLYAGTSRQNAEQVLTMLREEVERALANGISEEELIKAREQLKGGYILGLETPSSRMSNIGRSELLLNRQQAEDEVIEKINRVTRDDVQRIIEALLGRENAASAVGKNADNIPEEFLLWR